MSKVYRTVMMKRYDNVAVALERIPAGTSLTVVCQDHRFAVTIRADIAFGHKFAVTDMRAGEDVFKYGEVIGAAVTDICAGEHVHNLEGKRGRGDLLGKHT